MGRETMELFRRKIDDDVVQARCFYNENKVAVTSDGDFTRRQFYWGEDEQCRDELEAIKMAYAYVEALGK